MLLRNPNKTPSCTHGPSFITFCASGPQEQDPERRAAMAAIRDTRVDVCLYFVPPHRLRQVSSACLEFALRVPCAL